MTFSKKKLKYIAVYSSICLIILFIAFPFILTWGVNTTYVKDKISDNLYQKTDLRIHSSEFSLKIFPKPGIKIYDIDIHPEPDTRILIESIRFNLDITKLINGKINLGEIIINRPQIKTSFFKKKSSDSKNNVSFSQYTKKINEGFDLLPDDHPTLDIIINNATSDWFKNLDASATVYKNGKKIRLNTTIKNFSISSVLLNNPELKKHLDIKSIAIQQIQIEAKISEAQSIQGTCQLISPIINAENQAKLFETDKMNLSFSLSEKSQQIKLDPIQMNYPNGLLGIDFSNDLDKNQSNLVFSGKNIQVGQAREMSSVMFKDIDVPETLFDIVLDGVIPEINVSFKSDTFETLLNGNNLKLSGNIQKGRVYIPKTELIASDVNGTATIKNGVLDIKTTKGEINTSKIENGTLMVDLLNYENVPFKGEFNLDTNLSTLPETLISLLPGTLLSEELSKVHGVTGRCKATLNLALEDGSDDLLVQVKTKNFSVTGRYDRIPNTIVLNNINLEYKPDLIILNNASGNINGTVFTHLNTTIKLDKTPIINIHKGAGIIELKTAIPWLLSYPEIQKLISPIKDGAGKIFISSIALSGPVKTIKKWKYAISGKIDDISLSAVQNEKQIHGITCNYSISDRENTLESIQASILSIDLLRPFLSTNYLTSIRTPFKLNNAHLRTGSNPSFFRGDFNLLNGPQLKIDFKGNSFASLKINTVEIKDSGTSDARIFFNSDHSKPVFQFDGKLTTASLYKLLKPKGFLKKKLVQITENQPVSIYKDTDGVLNIITKNINMNSVLSRTRQKSSLLNTRVLTDDLINFKAEKFKIKRLSFSNVESKMSFNKNHSYIRIKKANLCGLNFGGYLNIKDGKVYANFPLEAKNKKNIQSLLTCLLNENKFMDGPYSLSCNLSANDVEPKELSKNLNGTLTLYSKQGRIYKLSLLSRILSVLNVSSVFKGKVPNITQEGFAYKELSINAQIKDSIIHLTDAVIDGQDMTMIFSGTIDPINDKLDLTCLVAPFKTVDLIIEKIPIINTLLGGSLVSVPVKADGKLSDPTVIPLHPSAVGEGIINMMSRILKAPVTLWEKMAKDNDKAPEK